MKGIKRGAVLEVENIEGSKIIIKDNKGENHLLPLHRAKDYDVYTKRDVTLSKGDEIRLNKNGFDSNGKRLNSSNILTVKGFTKEGKIKAIKNSAKQSHEYVLDIDHGNFDYAYCVTSYSSQGKTVDKVIISQPASTFTASNQKQFYVSVSRGRESVSIYTDDSQELLSHIEKHGDRQGATELITPNYTQQKVFEMKIKKDFEKSINTAMDYEPEI